MQKEVVTERQAISVIAIFVLGTAMITGVAKDAGENAWISLLLASIIAIPFQLMYARMLANFPGKHILEITDMVFGKIISKIIGVFFLWNGIYLGANLIKLFDQFIHIVDLNLTPEIVIITLVTLFLIQMLKSGITVFGRWSEFYLYLLIITFLFITTFLTPIKVLDNIVPVLYDGYKPVIEGTIDTLIFPMTQTFIFLLIFTNFSKKKSYYKVFTLGTLLGCVLLMIMTLDTLLVIGKDNYVASLFPPYITLRRLHIGMFFQRLEMLLILVFIYVGFIKIVAVYFSALISLKHIFNLKAYKPFVIPMCLLLAILGYLTYYDFLSHDIVVNTVYLPYAMVANIIVPFIIFIAEEIYVHFKLPKNKTKS